MILLNGTALFLPRADPAEILTLAKSERITALYLVPTIYYDLLKHIKEKAGSNFFVKKLAYAGAPMPVRMIKECQQVFSPEVFVSQYGCTEMLAITINCQLEKKPAAAGRPALQTSIRIVTADNSKEVMPHEILPPGKIGEIIVDASSPQTFLGYLKNPLQTNKVLRQGWYFTGDLGYIDQEGDLHLMGRVDDMIISGGENVYPQEVEQVLLQHPKVKEVAVTGLPHKRFGEIVTAFVVPKEKGLNSRELENFCLEHPELARFKRPRSFVFIEEIPKSAAGKVLRTSLKNGRIITNKEME
ncbi:MAG TPA: AMP-binding protein [Firmicutes bacterium]|nr:AMP-binding protein [Bacillota bacterium]